MWQSVYSIKCITGTVDVITVSDVTSASYGISNHWRLTCLSRLSRHSTKKQRSSVLWVLCEGYPAVTGWFPSQRASNVKNVFMLYCHHAYTDWMYFLFIFTQGQFWPPGCLWLLLGTLVLMNDNFLHCNRNVVILIIFSSLAAPFVKMTISCAANDENVKKKTFSFQHNVAQLVSSCWAGTAKPL